MGYYTDLLTGLAEFLDAAAVATWRGDGTSYQPGETAIILGDTPPEPDRVVALRAYHVSGTGTTDQITAVQVRTRGIPNDARDVDDLADSISDTLDYLEPGQLGPVKVSLIWRQSGPAPLPQDGNRRHERADTYYLHTSRVTAGTIQ